MITPSIALEILVTVFALVVAPLAGGLLFGIDRKLTARLQNRIGPPIVQPFYDFIKLWNKDQIFANRSQLIYVYVHLGAAMASLVLLVWQQDMLVILFTLALGVYPWFWGASASALPTARSAASANCCRCWPTSQCWCWPRSGSIW